ncbi:hypothetical protein CHL67_09585 [Prosthecochloris sp. GSB1]|uniref:DUF883 family protein n=1 Tax=Prosthecochloris sp. GSB1 TaxID=281093 RepID=UPI000B8C843E|nr:hypothetical protein [Prosthecochloris sp. GSB1]ASQ91134.1 hypothetical protein CHL67_09585 [Prosthecochloris sp. GSB1]
MTQEMPGNAPGNEKTEPSRVHETHTIPEQVEVLGETAARLYNQFRESGQYGKIQDKVSKAGEFIRDNPIPSVLYSLGAGFVLGLLLHRKR